MTLLKSNNHGGASKPGSNQLAVGVFCALIVVGLFSGFTLISRMGSKTELALADIAALRFGIGGLVLLPVFLKYRFAGLSVVQATKIAALGGLGFALFAYSGFFLAPASHGAVLLHGTLPLFTFLILLIVGDGDHTRQTAPGIALIGVGIVIMAIDTLNGASDKQLIGDACLLSASFCWSSYGITVRRLGASSVQAASIVAVISALIYFPVYLLGHGTNGLFSADRGDLLLQAVFQGVFIGALSIFVYTRAVLSLGATGTALFASAVPCVTTIAAIPLLGETPSSAALFGVAIVTIGMLTALAWPALQKKRNLSSR